MKNKNVILKLVISFLFCAVITTPVLANTATVPAACNPIPSQSHVALQNIEYAGFVHFNMGTFTQDDHCASNLNPNLFNPTALDCEQWAHVAKDAGMKMLMLTVKHHDGFCLWNSAYTDYDVGSSGWKDGKGDVVKEFVDACHKEGLRVGLYVSPSDNHHGSGPSSDYKVFMNNQLTELFDGSYGEIDELWWDGFGAGNIPEDSRDSWIATVRNLQPNCKIRQGFGPDFRWGGSETPVVGYPQWSTLSYDKAYELFKAGGAAFGQYVKTGDPEGTEWIPAEADPPAGSSWFWHSNYKAPQLSGTSTDGFETSVWRNANLLRGLAPDTTGKIPVEMVDYLNACKANRDRYLETAVAGGAANASNVRGNAETYQAGNALDGDHATYWAADDGLVSQVSIEIAYAAPQAIASLIVEEYFELGQRIKAFHIEAWDGTEWKTVFTGSTIGRKQLCSFNEAVKTEKIRLVIDDARACPLISEISVYSAKPTEDNWDIPKPDKPVGLTAALVSSTEMLIRWKDNPTNVTSYDLMINDKIETGVSYPYKHIGVQGGETYTYRVRASNISGNSVWSDPVTVTVASPDTPTGLKGKAVQSGRVEVTWNASSGASTYELMINGSIVVDIKDTAYLHKGVETGTFHFYQVRAVNVLGGSAWSNPVQVTATVPLQNLALGEGTSITANQYNGKPIHIPTNAADGKPSTRWAVAAVQENPSWLELDFGEPMAFNQTIIKEYTEKNQGRVSAYQIQYWDGERWMVTCEGTTLGVSKADTFEQVTSQKIRLYILESSPGPSIYEFEVYLNETAEPILPAIPAGLKAEAGEGSAIRVSWDASEGASSYDLMINDEVITGVANPYDRTRTTAGATYTYRVRAVSKLGASPWSGEVQAMAPDGGITSGGSSVVNQYAIVAMQSEGGVISPDTADVLRGGTKTFTIHPDAEYEIADVLVDGKSVGAVNTYTFKNVQTAHILAAEFKKSGKPANSVAGFKDVRENDWFAGAVEYVLDEGLMNGTSGIAFAPKSASTRGMIVTILYRQSGNPEVESDGATWWSDARAWAMEKGISDGTNMEKSITRAQLATMLYRYAELIGQNVSKSTSLEAFRDGTQVPGYAVDALKWAVAEGIVNGKTGNVLDPQAGASRAETATMLMRYCELIK